MNVWGIIGLVTGVALGGIAAWLAASARCTKRAGEAEGKLRYVEAQVNELRPQLEKKDHEITGIRNELDTERQLRSEAGARLDEAQKGLLKQQAVLEALEKRLSDKFSSISLDALSRNSREFLKLAEEKLRSETIEGKKELDGKKELIDKSLKEMDKTLSDVRQRVDDVSRGNVRISALVENHEKITSSLRDTTEHLQHALASSKKRGEWGERMAEDIIHMVGMVEGVNYCKQKTLEGSPGRPDYTFFMPNSLKINMDVKFPLDNYMHYLNAHSEHDRKRYKDELLKNTRVMIKQVTTRDYINPADNTVDYVLVFIPNEQVYGFINEADVSIMDHALQHKVVLCSPFTLYAVLSVIRQAVENFNLEKTAAEILKLLGEFSKQWGTYKDKFRVMGERLEAARKEYDALMTTRCNMLERPLKKIDELRKQKAMTFEADIKLDEEPVPENHRNAVES